MTRYVLASNNPGKVREINRMLSGTGINVAPQSEFNVPAVAETGVTFLENALIKARHAARHCRLPAIADDSGLEVDALDGAPGVYSARYAGQDADDQANLDKLLNDMAHVPDNARRGRFQCIMVAMRHAADPTPIVRQGTLEGTILRHAVGEHGFGYDPIFLAPAHNRSCAELSADEKNAISHRGQALRALVAALIHG